MGILYIFDCMWGALISAFMNPYDVEVKLFTTGEGITAKEFLIGLVGCFTILFLGSAIYWIRKYSENKDRLKYTPKKQLFTKKEKIVIYIMMGVSLIVFLIGLVLVILHPEKLNGTIADCPCLFIGTESTLAFSFAFLNIFLGKKLRI